jgi:hypothetical protein
MIEARMTQWSLKKLHDYNKQRFSTSQTKRKQGFVENLWEPALLSDTLAKHLIVDSGQHKDQQKQATTRRKSVTQAK